MTTIKCDRWACKFRDTDSNVCKALEVKLEEQGDCNLQCLTFENYERLQEVETKIADSSLFITTQLKDKGFF